MEASSLAVRLQHAEAKVRRLAILDALRTPAAHAPLLTAHLEQERDERALLLLIRGLTGMPAAMPALIRLRDDPNSTPAVAHAALLACDTPP